MKVMLFKPKYHDYRSICVHDYYQFRFTKVTSLLIGQAASQQVSNVSGAFLEVARHSL